MIDAIVATKRREIAELKRFRPGRRKRPVLPLQLDGGVNVIAELKQKSPSAGKLAGIDDRRISIYSEYARGISVLTDANFFGGSLALLKEVAEKTHLPVLCKDFIMHPVQIDMAYAAGADLILLIARILDGQALKELYAYATWLGLQCLVEVHNSEELEQIDCLNPQIVGVNARDLDTLEIDLNAAGELLKSVRAPVRIAESGIRSRKDMEKMKDADAFLIGETLMRSTDLESTFKDLLYG